MPCETASCSYVSQLHPEWPTASETMSGIVGHFLVLKRAAVDTFKNINSEVSATPSEMNKLIGLTANFQTQLTSLVTLKNNMSLSVQTQLNGMSASINASKLNISSTAQSMIRWGGMGIYWQTDTPSAEIGDVWFET